ncbi:hypothetical protein F2P81_017347 [Scophthalmus maximus]|uniref:Uncharacterized protein n=1 Tax=Scophthalmus maximus TaxID=52904 RepID=A0A6A4S5W2_SCOMX|nr:hypothetical protein F2P81_017347 [Scophthalmus maximus]
MLISMQDPSGASRTLSRTEFIDLARSSVGRGSKEEYGLLFDSVVVTQEHRGLLLDSDAVKEEGRVDWGGLCSFLLLELSDKMKHSRSRSVPCWKPPRTLTCPHRDQVQKVLYLQSSGQYLTLSKGGTVGLRDGEDMSLTHTHRLQNSTVAPKDLWATDVVLLHNVHKVAVSFTSKEVCFYDILSKQDFSCKYKLQGLKFTPWCLDYWVDRSHPDQAVLTIGDIGGQVSALHFTSVEISLFERLGPRTDSDSADIVLWDELVKGKHRSCYTVLCLWDVSSQQCVHRLAGVFPRTQEDTHTLLFLHEERHLLLLSFNSLLLLLETVKEEKRTSSHEQPVTCVLYNSLFRQVWDFNGRCLHRMNAGLGRAVEITQVLLLKRSILVMGWERMLTVFRLHSFSQSLVEPSEWKGGVQHRSDLLCAAFQPPQTLVTGSYDGEIIVWNNGTEKALRRLQPRAEQEDDRTQQGGADLVSCGGSGVVRLWNTFRSRPVGQFAAHNRDLGSIVMTVSPCGKYLVTADREGTLKTWDIQTDIVPPVTRRSCITVTLIIAVDNLVYRDPEKIPSNFHTQLAHFEIELTNPDENIPDIDSKRWGFKRLFAKDASKYAGGIPESPERGAMNLNKVVLPPDNKARSVKLNARNLRVLQIETVTQESKEIEEKLQQLKRSMSKEKEERGCCAGIPFFHADIFSSLTFVPFLLEAWHCESNAFSSKVPAPQLLLNLIRYTVRITLSWLPQNCAECTENYCIGCFARFHQKGALKLHRMIPFQLRADAHHAGSAVSNNGYGSPGYVMLWTELRTHVSTRDVLSYSPSTSTSPSSNPVTSLPVLSSASSRRGGQSPEIGREAVEKPLQTHPDTSQVLVANRAAERRFEMGLARGDEKGFPTSLLSGEYNEEESASSFQAALRQWRGETSDGAGDATISAIAIQADLPPDREAEGQESGGGKGRMTLRVEFTEDNLTYMDRLLLKKHRRLPIQTYDPSLAFRPDLKSDTNTKEEEVESSLTAREEDFRRYCASLFAVPVTGGRTQTQIATPEPCLVIEVLDERLLGGRVLVAIVLPIYFQHLYRVGVSPHSPTQASRHSSRASTEPKTALELGPPKPQTSKAEHAMKSLPSKSLPSPCPTAETTRTSQTSIKTPNSKSQKPTCSPAVPKSKAHHEIPNLLCFPPLFPSDVSLAVRHSTPLRQRSDSSLQPEQSQSSNLFQEPISSPMLSQSAPSNLEAPEQSQHSLSDPDSFLSDNELKLPQSSGPNPRPKSLEPTQSQTNPAPFSTAVKTLSSSFNQSPSEVNSREKSTPSYGDATVYTSSPSFSGDPESTHQARQDTKCIPSISSHPLNVVQNHPFTVRMKEEEELSMDSGDEMSSDSLDLASHDGGSSDEDAQMRGRLTRRRSREGEQGISATSHLGDSFVPAHADVEKDLQTDEPERLSEEPYTVTHNWSAGSGSERLSSLQGLSPRRVDLNSAHSDTPEHTHFDPGSTVDLDVATEPSAPEVRDTYSPCEREHSKSFSNSDDLSIDLVCESTTIHLSIYCIFSLVICFKLPGRSLALPQSVGFGRSFSRRIHAQQHHINIWEGDSILSCTDYTARDFQ